MNNARARRQRVDQAFKAAFEPFNPEIGRLELDDPRAHHSRMKAFKQTMVQESLREREDLSAEYVAKETNPDEEFVEYLHRCALYMEEQWGGQVPASVIKRMESRQGKRPNTSASVQPNSPLERERAPRLSDGNQLMRRSKSAPPGATSLFSIPPLKPLSRVPYEVLELIDKVKRENVALADQLNALKQEAQEKKKLASALKSKVNDALKTQNLGQREGQKVQVHAQSVGEKLELVTQQVEAATEHKEALEIVSSRFSYVNRSFQVRTARITTELSDIVGKMAEMYSLTQEVEKGSWEAEDHLAELKVSLAEERETRQTVLEGRRQLWEEVVAASFQQPPRSPSPPPVRKLNEVDEEAEAYKELEKRLLTRAPIKEQLAWDRVQPRRIAASMERIEQFLGLSDSTELINKYFGDKERREALDKQAASLHERSIAAQAALKELKPLLQELVLSSEEGNSRMQEEKLQSSAWQCSRKLELGEDRLQRAERTTASFQMWMNTMLERLDCPVPSVTDAAKWNEQTLALLEERLLSFVEKIENATASPIPGLKEVRLTASPLKYHSSADKICDHPLRDLPPPWDAPPEEVLFGGEDEELDEDGKDGLWNTDGTRVLPESKRWQPLSRPKTAEADPVENEAGTPRKKKHRNKFLVRALRDVPLHPASSKIRTCACCVDSQEFDMSLLAMKPKR
mmetsp:Transcript_11838/g.27192  ORF Transcript_11838/g.27192 Transcript_11838/m.27192 type:complete len:687 (+) Transcript_11838:59-2119(+)